MKSKLVFSTLILTILLTAHSFPCLAVKKIDIKRKGDQKTHRPKWTLAERVEKVKRQLALQQKLCDIHQKPFSTLHKALDQDEFECIGLAIENDPKIQHFHKEGRKINKAANQAKHDMYPGDDDDM